MSKAKDQFKAILKNKKHHYNDVETSSFCCSTGSLKLDIEIGGGVFPGVIRASGASEGGKSSIVLTIARFFQQLDDKKHVIYVRAEGRPKDKNIEKFELDNNKFDTYDSNAYEEVCETIREMINNNPEKNNYIFIIDSMDAMIPIADMDKPFAEANKVAGGALLTSDFLRRMSLPIMKHGHLAYLISQVRATIKASQYAPSDPNKLTNGAGGNALTHYSDWIFEVQKPTLSDLIRTDPKDKNSDILGHFANIIIRKSDNESTFKRITYPIKHGRRGSSVWVEYEILQLLLQYGFVNKKGAWFSFAEHTLEELKENNITIDPKFQGEKNLLDYLEGNEEVVQYFYQYFVDTYL